MHARRARPDSSLFTAVDPSLAMISQKPTRSPPAWPRKPRRQKNVRLFENLCASCTADKPRLRVPILAHRLRSRGLPLPSNGGTIRSVVSLSPSLRGAPRGSPSARPSESRESPEKPHEVPGSDLRLFAVGLFLRCSGGEQKVIATHAERAEGLAPALAAQQRSLASAGPLRRAILRNGRTKKRKTNRATRLTRKARFGPTKSYWTHKKITTEPRATSGNRSPTKKATKRRAPTRSWAHTMTGPDPRGSHHTGTLQPQKCVDAGASAALASKIPSAEKKASPRGNRSLLFRQKNVQLFPKWDLENKETCNL